MKERKVMISYPEMKLDAIAQSAKGDKSIEELLAESVDDLFKKTVPKDVQNFLNVMQEQKKKSREKSAPKKPDTEPSRAVSATPAPQHQGRNLSHSSGSSYPTNSGN